MIHLRVRVRIISTGELGIVYTTKRYGSNPIGVILDKEKGYDFLDGEIWVPGGKEGYAWVGEEDELEVTSEPPLEILYESLMEPDVKTVEGYYKR